MSLSHLLSLPVEPPECPKSDIGYHKWEEESLIPEHWAFDEFSVEKFRARCQHCGETTDDLSVLDTGGSSGPLGPSYTGF